METISISAETDAARGAFFKTILGRAKGYLCIAHVQPMKRSTFTEVFFRYPEELPRALQLINEMVRTHNIYYCPQLFASRKRTKQTVAATPSAWADLDFCDPDSLFVEPTIVIESSPDRFQALWSFDREVDPDDAEDLSRRIAYKHSEQGADRSGWDLTQLLRVPMTYNFKYKTDGPELPIIKAIHTSRNKYRLPDFEEHYPPVSDYLRVDIPIPREEDLPRDPDDLLAERRLEINAKVWQLYLEEPGIGYELDDQGWSKPLWNLQMMLFEAGFTREEVYCVARAAKCNKYDRDGKPALLLWKEVCRADAKNQANIRVLAEGVRDDKEPPLLSDEEREKVTRQQDTFIERYIEWARSLGDAAPQYHQAGAFVALSSVLAGPIRLPTSFGTIIPNLWFMLLADTCQPLESRILTPTGWTTMGEIRSGDLAIGRDGKPTLVQATSNVREDDVYKVTFLDGAEVECTEDHLWTVKATYERTMPLSEVKEHWLKKNNKPVVPKLDGPVQFMTPVELPMDPYLLGIWLGEGCRSNAGYANFALEEEELVKNVEEVLPAGLHVSNYTPKSGRWKSWTWHIQPDVRLGPNPVRDYLVSSELITTYSRERFIPNVYKFASVSDRLALLQGLLDGEGHVMKSGNIKMESSSKQLINDTVDLIRSLGGIARFNGPNYHKLTSCPTWVITFTPPPGLVPFRLERKVAKINQKGSAWNYRGIASIEYAGRKAVRCIKVAASDGLYITDGFVVTRNTITRKTTSMDLAVDMVAEVDPDVLLATDGSLEGLLTSLASRPNRPSIFLRDEFSGLLEMMTKKDYYAGMGEFLTKLYDGKMQKRILRRETVEVRDPILILFAGGIKNKITQLLTWDHVSSGFLPRFVIITAESDINKTKPIGPPTTDMRATGTAIKDELADIFAHYRRTVSLTIKQVKAQIERPRTWEAELTPDAWVRYNKLESDMLDVALKAEHPDTMTPTYDRLSKSILKSAVLLAAAGQRSETIVVEEKDILRTIMYGEQWRVHTREALQAVGKGAEEKQLDAILRMIVKEPAVTRSKIMQTHHLNARSAAQIFDTLEQRGLIIKRKAGRTEQFWPLLAG